MRRCVDRVLSRSRTIAVTTRSARDEDEPFLRLLIIETLAEQLRAWSWPEPMRGPLLEIQYAARRQTSRAALPAAESILVVDGQDAGWMIVADLAQEIRIVEIMVLRAYRGRGVGSAVIRGILAAGKPVRLRVDVLNIRAIALYERLGFRVVERGEVQLLMERLPDAD